MAFSYHNYTGDNSTTTFNIPFTYTATSEISVTVDGVAETGLTFPSSTEVTLTSAPASGTLVQVRRTTVLTSRTVDFVSGSVLTEEDLDNSNIQVFHAAQEAVDKSNDGITLGADDKWDAQSKVIKNVADPVANTDAVNKQFITTNLPNINTVAGIASDVTTVAGISTDVTAVADDATDIGTVSTNIANVNTVAGISANVTTVAGINADVTTVAADGTDIGIVAGISADVTTVAGISTDVAAVEDIASNVTAVAGNATNINAVAGNATNINSVASNSTNINAVAADATDIGTVAGISANVSTVAGISADVTTVAADATDIGLVAGSIANVNTTAANIADVNNFASTYRIGATDPTTSLDEGDLFYNTTDNSFKYYNGSAWTAVESGLTDVVSDTTPQLGGDLASNGNDIIFADNDKAIFGAGSDLQVYHNGSTSYILEQGTGDLRIRGSEVRIEDGDGSTIALFKEDAGAELRYDGSVKLTTTATGVDVTGSAIATTQTASVTGSTTLDFGANQNFILTLTGSITLANPTTEQVGQSGFITFIQTGGYTVSLGTDYETAGGAGITLSASGTDVVPYIVAASGRILLGTPQLAFA